MMYRLIYLLPPIAFPGFIVKVLIVSNCIAIIGGFFWYLLCFFVLCLVSWMFYDPSNVMMTGDSMSLAGFDLFPIIGNVWI